MNNRLETIAAMVPEGRGLIDVGTDHGYLPAALAGRGYGGKLFASDIREGPLQAAKHTAAAEGVADQIQFLLCDGLSQCDPTTIDTIVIAGLGGDTICRILDQAEWTMDSQYTMILQPMTKAEVLRYWLSNNEYEIIRETLVEDAGKLYSILTVRFGRSEYLRDAELFTGSIQKVSKDPLFPRFLAIQIERIEKALAGIQAGRNGEDTGRQRLLNTVLLEMKEIRNHGSFTGYI